MPGIDLTVQRCIDCGTSDLHVEYLRLGHIRYGFAVDLCARCYRFRRLDDMPLPSLVPDLVLVLPDVDECLACGAIGTDVSTWSDINALLCSHCHDQLLREGRLFLDTCVYLEPERVTVLDLTGDEPVTNGNPPLTVPVGARS